MFDKIKNLLIEKFNIEDEITPDTALNDLGINSIELADLILDCEDDLGIEIDDEVIHKFVTVGDIADYLEGLT